MRSARWAGSLGLRRLSPYAMPEAVPPFDSFANTSQLCGAKTILVYPATNCP